MAAELQEYTRLSQLGEKVKAGTATKQEKDEFIDYMYSNGKMTKEQYDDYKAGRNKEEVTNAVLAAGAILLIAYLIDRFSSSK